MEGRPGLHVHPDCGRHCAALGLFAIASGKDGFDAVASGFASNGYGDRSPNGYNMISSLLAEIILTAIFLYVILGATDKREPKGFAGLSIGLILTLIHLVSIPITNTSVNPARSIGVAWFAGSEALGQVWLFILASLIGAAIAGVSYQGLFGEKNITATTAGGDTHKSSAGGSRTRGTPPILGRQPGSGSTRFQANDHSYRSLPSD